MKPLESTYVVGHLQDSLNPSYKNAALVSPTGSQLLLQHIMMIQHVKFGMKIHHFEFLVACQVASCSVARNFCESLYLSSTILSTSFRLCRINTLCPNRSISVGLEMFQDLSLPSPAYHHLHSPQSKAFASTSPTS